MRRKGFIIILLALTGLAAYAAKPQFVYDVDFLSYFDNREYQAPYQTAQTIFNFRLSPTIGLQFTDTLGGKHQLIAGVNYTQRLGGNWRDVQFDPTAYYSYTYKGYNVSLGAVPYFNRIERLPDFLQYDSVAYYHPNIQGAHMSYQSKWGFAEFMCDWRGAQTEERREMFYLVLNGRFQYKWFDLGGFVTLNHKALRKGNPDHEGVCDDLYLNPQIGFNLHQLIHPHKESPSLGGVRGGLDSLSLHLGYILGYQRERQFNVLRLPQGFMANFYFNYWFIGLENTFYYGQPLMPFYDKYAPDLNQGDPFYRARLYNRTDIFLYLFRNSFVNCFFSWNLHYASFNANGSKGKLQNQQQLTVRFNLDSLLRKNSSKLRNLGGK